MGFRKPAIVGTGLGAALGTALGVSLQLVAAWLPTKPLLLDPRADVSNGTERFAPMQNEIIVVASLAASVYGEQAHCFTELKPSTSTACT